MAYNCTPSLYKQILNYIAFYHSQFSKCVGLPCLTRECTRVILSESGNEYIMVGSFLKSNHMSHIYGLFDFLLRSYQFNKSSCFVTWSHYVEQPSLELRSSCLCLYFQNTGAKGMGRHSEPKATFLKSELRIRTSLIFLFLPFLFTFPLFVVGILYFKEFYILLK